MDVELRVCDAKIGKKLRGDLLIRNGTNKSVRIDLLTAQLHSWQITSQQHFKFSPGSIKALPGLENLSSGEKALPRNSGSCQWQGLPCEVLPQKANPFVLLSDKEVPSKSTIVVVLSKHLSSHLLPSYSGKTVQLKTKLHLEMFSSGNKKRSMWFPVQLLPSPTAAPQILPNDVLRETEVKLDASSEAETRDPESEDADGDEDDDEEEDEETLGQTSNALRRTNPFLTEKKKDRAPRLPAKHARDPLFTRISDDNGEIVKLHLLSTDLYPGQSIFGVLDFRESVPSMTCTQFCVSLFAVERIPKQFTKGSTAVHEERVLHGTASEVCLGLATTSFELHIPEQATPSFKSNLVSLNWILKFEFVLTDSMEQNQQSPKSLSFRGRVKKADEKKVSDAKAQTWKAPARLTVKTRKWETPIKIYKV